MIGVLLLTCTLGGAQRAESFGKGDKGTAAAQFLKIGPGARAAGMAEAFSGVADDVHSVYYNPAGLGFLKTPEVAAMHNTHFQGINYEFAAVAVPMLSWIDTKREKNVFGVLGVSVTNLAIGNIERRGATETDAPSESFESSDFAYAVGYGYAIPEYGLGVGGVLKYIDSSMDSQHAGSIAGDFGVLYRHEKVSFGTGVRHAGQDQRFGLAADALPLTFYAGVGYRPTGRFLTSLDAVVANDSQPRLAWGAEYIHPFNKLLSGAIRAGYATYGSKGVDSGGISGASFGAGLGYGRVAFDFAWVPMGDLGDSLRFSLHAKF